MTEDGNDTAKRKPAPEEDRKTRLEQALRANLRRRKAQSRARDAARDETTKPPKSE